MKNIFKFFLIIIPFVSFYSIADVHVIVHPSNDAIIKKLDVKKIFLGKTTNFKNGKLAIPINLSDEIDIRTIFNMKILSRTNSQVARAWSKIEFTNTGTPPSEKTATEVIELIANNPNMIGYIDSQYITTKNVKVVLTIK